MTQDEVRWNSHFMTFGPDFKPFWQEICKRGQRSLLVVCGAGFDPRALSVVEAITSTGVRVDECRLVEFSSGSGLVAPEDLERAENHRNKLRQMFPGKALKPVHISMRSREGRSIGGIRISEAFRDRQSYVGFSDVVVDITALPAELYFPLIATLLQVWHFSDGTPLALGNLHIAVCHNPVVDSLILPEGGDKAELMYGFPGTIQRASIGNPIRTWAPILGENQVERLQKITEFVGPEVVSPILPFPARNPRRGDELLLEYRSLLFETWEVPPSDIIYADEQNPFDVYSKLCALSFNYKDSLSPIGTAQMIVSSHSSKLHSLGALLAAWEQDFGVAHVQPTGHVVNGRFGPQHEGGELFEIWLAGEPYAGA